MCIDEKQAGQIITRLENVEKISTKTVESLYGDGKPGILERVGKIEVSVGNVLEQSKNNAVSIEKVLQQAAILADKAIKEASHLVERTETKSIALIRQVADDNTDTINKIESDNTKVIQEIKLAIEEIKDSVAAHHTDKELHTFRGLFLKKDILVWVIVGFLLLHSILPQEFDLFEIIRKIFGF